MAEEKGGIAAGLVETVKTVVYALLIAGVFRTLFFQPFWIPSGSMKETLLIGDFLFVNKMAYGYSYASVFTVPADEFFFMGDNRDNSTDSRVPAAARGVGFVPREDIVGRADRVMFSSAGRSMLAFWNWRSDRFFKGLE